MPTRAEMVENQLRARGIEDERTLAAMGSVPRERFLPPAMADSAYDDGALPIGYGQTLSQPWIVAAICQALELRGGERVLEVGTGTGYSAAVLARLAAEVVSIEFVEELAVGARESLRSLGVANVEVRSGDGAAGHAEQEFDAIAVHAAVPRLPPSLVRALRVGGRIVAPVTVDARGEMLRVFLRLAGEDASGSPPLSPRDVSPSRFVPLRGEAGYDAD